MTRSDDHGPLPDLANRLVRTLDDLGSRLVHAEAEHSWHREFAERGALLGDHLRAAMELSHARRYAPALVVVRAALEHHLIDRLLFLANRYLQVYSVKKEDITAEEARLTELRSGPRPDIARWWMANGMMNVVVRGLFMTGRMGRSPILSPYYAVVDQYDPFTGKSAHQPRLAGEFRPVAARRRSADEARAVWLSLFRYPKLIRNLRLNALITVAQALQLDVHYAFLSAYAHPMGRAYELVYGQKWSRRRRSFDHHASELILLYAIVLAGEELATFRRMSRRPPQVGIRGWEAIERDVAECRQATSYFWFMSGEPQVYDRIAEIHTRLARRRQAWGLPRSDPMAIPTTGVRYYVNPLERLVRLHGSSEELVTGLTHRSPFA